MTSPKRFIKIRQGATMATYKYYAPNTLGDIVLTAVKNKQHPLVPVLFRKGRRLA